MDWYKSDTNTYHSGFDSLPVNGILKHIYAMTTAERTNLKLVPTQIGPHVDSRLYANEVEHRNGPEITYTGTLRSLDDVKTAKKAQVAAHRYQVEIGGCKLPNGTDIASDDRAKMLLNGAYNRAKGGDPEATRKFKTRYGFVDISNAQIVTMAEVIADHVQACFDAEAAHCTAIDAIPPNEVEPLAALLAVIEYDHLVGWPV